MVVACLIIVSTPGPGFFKVNARFGWPRLCFANLVTRLTRSWTRLVKARARSLTILTLFLELYEKFPNF